jgi:hypothetical protein
MSLCDFSPPLHAEAKLARTMQKKRPGLIVVKVAPPGSEGPIEALLNGLEERAGDRLPQSEFLEVFTEKFPSIFTLLSAR